MIKHFNEQINTKYFDKIYDFKGLWDVDSKCGLKIVSKPDQTIVVTTELYAENPGSSVTSYCAQLATIIANEFAIAPEKMVFIVRDPETESKLTFMHEHFYRVDLQWNGTKFMNARWNEISKEVVDNLI